MTIGRQLEITQRQDPDGVLRLSLIGQLDLASAPHLNTRLGHLKHERQRVRVDLSKLEFFDSSGISELVHALRDARTDGWRLEISRDVSPQVQRVIEITGISSYLWPPEDP